MSPKAATTTSYVRARKSGAIGGEDARTRWCLLATRRVARICSGPLRRCVKPKFAGLQIGGAGSSPALCPGRHRELAAGFAGCGRRTVPSSRSDVPSRSVATSRRTNRNRSRRFAVVYIDDANQAEEVRRMFYGVGGVVLLVLIV